MAFFWSSKKKQKTAEPAFSMPDMVRALTAKGISTTDQEFTEMFQRVYESIALERCFPESVHESFSAELMATTSGYTLYLSFVLADGGGNFGGLDIALPLAAFYATASEFAKLRGVSQFILKKDDRLAVCDWNGAGWKEPHPLQTIMPHLLKISLLHR